MDCLIPAVDAYKSSVGNGEEFVESLSAMCTAAEKGRDSTKNLVSKVGRSSRLGERSRGVIDAGAASCAIILCSMAASIKELISK
jgi:dihydroxyacetone kinase-like protein